MQPDSPYPGITQTVQQRMAQIDQERQDFRQLNESVKDLLPRMSEQDLIGYIDHRLLFGEPAALKWVLSKLRPPVVLPLGSGGRRRGKIA